jgi:hypothetical protein
MFPAVYQTLRANATVVSLVGTRIGRHGEVPQGTTEPYITWQSVSGQPFDHLSGAPVGDFDTIQLDCDHTTDAGIEALARAVRDALDTAGVHNRVRLDLRESDTRLYRVAIEADFITSR